MGKKLVRAGGTRWAALPRVWVPCDVGTGCVGPARVCDEAGLIHDVTAGTFCIVDVPLGKGGEVVGRLAIGGRLVKRDGNRLLVHFADGRECWVALLSDMQIEDGPTTPPPSRGEVALAVALQGAA